MKLNNFLLLITAALIAGCVGGNNQGLSSPKSSSYLNTSLNTKNPSSQETLKSVGAMIPVSDLIGIVGEGEKKQCSKDNSVCVTFNGTLGATYTSTSNGEKTWVSQDIYSNALTATFSSSKPAGFHISKIYSENLNNPNVGRIKQINTSGCDKAQKGKCNISFVYRGMAFIKAKNEIHIQFASDKNSDLLDFSFVVQNTTDNTLQNLPNLENVNISSSSGINYIINGSQETENGTGLSYPIIFVDDGLKNNGLKEMPKPHVIYQGEEEEHSTIDVTKSRFFNTANDLYFSNSYQTTCSNNPVQQGDFCSLLFTEHSDNPTKSSTHYGSLRYQYYLTAESISAESEMEMNKNSHTYSTQFVIGQGDLDSRDYTLASNDMHLQVTKYNIIDNLHDATKKPVYTISLRNFKLRLEYDPQFYIGYRESDTGIEYAYGDIADKIRDNLSVEVDNSACFEDPAYDDNSENNFDPTKIKCGVTIKLKDPTLLFQLKQSVVGIQLYASYLSPTQHKQIDQLIGNVTIDVDNGIPQGIYTSVWPKDQIRFDGVTLKVFDNSKPMGTSSELDYYDTCAPKSTVSTLPIYYWQQGSRDIYDFQPLKCDKLAAKFPSGNYSDDCVSLSFKNGVLTGSCRYRTPITGDRMKMNVLNYAKDCGDRSPVYVNDNDGTLACGYPR